MTISLTKQKLKVLSVATTIILALTIAGGYILITQTSNSDEITITNCTPTFYDGDGPYYKNNAPLRSKLYSGNVEGEKLKITGHLLNTDCTKTIPNATIDIWQADPTGNYQDENFRGKIVTNKNGEFEFETLMPKGYGSGTGYRPPHIHYKVTVNGKLIVTSEIFFEDTRGKPGFNENYIVELKKKGDVSLGDYNIVLPDYL